MEIDQKFKLTPMYEQYLRIKDNYPGALLFFRMGDFYELFFDDAVTVSRELQLTLTSRSRDESGVPMCGVPWHALDSNLNQLISRGYTVAVCDQVEDPRTAKGLVKRAVTRIETAGTTLEDGNLDAKSHNYLGALFWNENNGRGGFAWVDVTTGFWTGLHSGKLPELWQWVLKMSPRELLFPDQGNPPASLGLQNDIRLVRVPYRSHFEPKQALVRVLAAQKVAEANALNLDKRQELTQACGALIAYLSQTQQRNPEHLAAFKPIELGRFMVIDEITERNLELFRRLDGKKGPGTLWQIMDQTMTPMGGRLLEERLRFPWKDLAPIHDSQGVVAFLTESPDIRAKVRQALGMVYDLERLSTRILLNRCLPRDLAAYRDSILALPELQKSFAGRPNSDNANNLPSALFRMNRNWDNLVDMAHLLKDALLDNLPTQITDGGLFRAGYNAELDELLDLVEHGESKLQELLSKEQAANNLPKLKLGYNRVFGYYFELTKSRLSGTLPEHFQRRQTMANAERFVTSELKELEDKLLSASETQKSLEYKLFNDLREKLSVSRPRILFMADLIAYIDYWQSLAEVAVANSWSKPDLNNGRDLQIVEGRHPVVESIVGQAAFIPNNILLDAKRSLLLITGPNMAGKSTVLRQTAIICILAQMGSYVPANQAAIGLIDRIFSRVGASDNLAQGQSTFMVEMMETARILRQASKNSLVILDEIGRGTSTFDGMALAWAVVENLAMRAGGNIRTLFATHYLELAVLQGRIPGIFNMNIGVREWNGELIFNRRLIPGPADKSYGIEVARLAGVPPSIVARAREIMSALTANHDKSGITRATAMVLPGLENIRHSSEPEDNSNNLGSGGESMNLSGQAREEHPVLKALRGLNPNTLTPFAALELLAEWHAKWGQNHESS